MSPDRWHARPLRSSDRPQPVAVWASRLELALFPILLLAIVLLVVVLAPGGAA